jgi:hypothetical protein
MDITPATRLLEKRREIQDLELGLVHEKEDFRVRMDMLTQRRNELNRKEKMLGDSLAKFEKFLKVSCCNFIAYIQKDLD